MGPAGGAERRIARRGVSFCSISVIERTAVSNPHTVRFSVYNHSFCVLTCAAYALLLPISIKIVPASHCTNLAVGFFVPSLFRCACVARILVVLCVFNPPSSGARLRVASSRGEEREERCAS